MTSAKTSVAFVVCLTILNACMLIMVHGHVQSWLIHPLVAFSFWCIVGSSCSADPCRRKVRTISSARLLKTYPRIVHATECPIPTSAPTLPLLELHLCFQCCWQGRFCWHTAEVKAKISAGVNKALKNPDLIDRIRCMPKRLEMGLKFGDVSLSSSRSCCI